MKVSSYLTQKLMEASYEAGHALGTKWVRQRQEKERRAAVQRFRLKATTEAARFTELLRIAQERGLLNPVQQDPRVQAVGFTDQPPETPANGNHK